MDVLRVVDPHELYEDLVVVVDLPKFVTWGASREKLDKNI